MSHLGYWQVLQVCAVAEASGAKPELNSQASHPVHQQQSEKWGLAPAVQSSLEGLKGWDLDYKPSTSSSIKYAVWIKWFLRSLLDVMFFIPRKRNQELEFPLEITHQIPGVMLFDSFTVNIQVNKDISIVRDSHNVSEIHLQITWASVTKLLFCLQRVGRQRLCPCHGALGWHLIQSATSSAHSVGYHIQNTSYLMILFVKI